MVDWEAGKEFGLPLSGLPRSVVRAVRPIRKRPLRMRELLGEPLLALRIGGELTALADLPCPAGAFSYAPVPMDVLVRLCRIVEATD